MKKKMKIYYLFNNKFEKVPMIKISNKMLEKCGFKVGDTVEYEYSYTYRYGGFPEERVIPGSFVVEAPTE